MENFVAQKLSDQIVSGIKDFINSKHDTLAFYNQLIREDILPLLDSQCTIIYFPTEDKDNNGFHKTYRFHGENKHFVYINTNQDIEKQIFTAAHELGHVWKVNRYIEKLLDTEINYELGERIINRFAAELLMPEVLFSKYLYKLFEEKLQNNKTMTVESIIQIITSVMNEFYVPYKSVVYRMYELGFIHKNSAEILWDGTNILSKETIINYSKRYANEQGYVRLYHPNKKRHIENLKDLLDVARKKSLVPQRWLQEFYRRFSLNSDDTADSLKTTILVERDKEIIDNAGESSN